jgi:hypothetical protein
MDLNQHLIRHPAATFIVRVSCYSRPEFLHWKQLVPHLAPSGFVFCGSVQEFFRVSRSKN